MTVTVEKKRLAQVDEVMFERNIAIIASKKEEVRVYSASFVYEGFISGLDENWLQIYGHSEEFRDDPNSRYRFLLLQRTGISGVGTTGKNIKHIQGDDYEFISDKIAVFSEVSSKFGVRNGRNTEG